MMTSQVTRKLEARGLLERALDPADSRARRLHLTAAGRAVVSSSASRMLKPRMRTTSPPWADSAMHSYGRLRHFENFL